MATPDTPFLDSAFRALTGNDPFPWQRDFFRRLIAGERLSDCNVPTGLGKTAVIAVWLIALAHHVKSNGACALTPRRLVYVVNRRTVVDQSTGETEKIRKRLNGEGELSDADRTVLKELRCLLAQLYTADHDEVLAISTLRGQFADNGEWRSDPSRPAVIVGAVDVIGSRLLFSGYGCGFRTKPLHAGFLGQDVLLIHDETHLEPAFQELLIAVEKEQRRSRELRAFQVMALSATSRGQEEEEPFGLTAEEKDPPDVIPKLPTKPVHVVWRRLRAEKAIHLHKNSDEKKLGDQIATLALKHEGSGQAVLVFVRKLEDVAKVLGKLPKGSAEQLTGTLRGWERDQLVEKPIFQRFLPKAEPEDKTVYLVCTSAGEVGVDISADHMVCDLTPLDSMIQRFGRVNRFGDRDDTRIDVVHPTKFDEKKDDQAYQACRRKTLALLNQLNGDGSPAAIGNLKANDRIAAFSPAPTILPATDILFDAWALTTIKGRLPGRPPVEPYLHGIRDWEPPETHVAWREEVGIIADELLERYEPDELLDDYPVKPHELLRDLSNRVFDHLAALVADPKPKAKLKPDERRQAMERAAQNRRAAVWVVKPGEPVRVVNLAELVDERKQPIFGVTLLLPPAVGGLQDGMLNGGSATADDVADNWFEDATRTTQRRVRVWGDDVRWRQFDGQFECLGVVGEATSSVGSEYRCLFSSVPVWCHHR